jgi:apolipoprotein N-acyltransferase
VVVDQSTIYRWRKWFELNGVNIIMALLGVTAIIGINAEASPLTNKGQEPGAPIKTIQTMVGHKAKWLSETVRVLVNSSRWIFNRSAFLTG